MKLNYQLFFLVVVLFGPICASNSQTPIVKRVGDSPIIFPELDSSIGTNIQGPSAIRVPDWVENPLGNYYLYFADHKGSYIRLAYANQVEGPWRIHKPGALRIKESFFLTKPPLVSEEQAKQIHDFAKRNISLNQKCNSLKYI